MQSKGGKRLLYGLLITAKRRNTNKFVMGFSSSEGPDRRIKLLTEILVLLARDLNWRNATVCPKSCWIGGHFQFFRLRDPLLGKTWKNVIFSEAYKMPNSFENAGVKRNFLSRSPPQSCKAKIWRKPKQAQNTVNECNKAIVLLNIALHSLG